MKIIIIAAVSKNNVIGSKGSIPWNSREELLHFKNTTMGFPLIMGRKTFESLGKPLTGRLNIIITTQPELFIKFEGVKCFSDAESAITYCRNENFEKVFIAGGETVYNSTIDLADEMIISRMQLFAEGERYFPLIDEAKWIVNEKKPGAGFEVLYYVKKKEDEQQ